MEGEINPLLKPFAYLVGRWETQERRGVGYFPTIKDFQYNDVLEFGLCGSQPLLSYSARSTHPEKGVPMHLESGFLRSKGNGDVSFMVAHNFGLTTVEEGKVDGNLIQMTSSHVGRMSGSKDPSVLQIKREWKLENEDKLTCRLWMATTTTPTLTEHLFATYQRIK